MKQIKSSKIRPKFKKLVKYKTFYSLRVFNLLKSIKQKRLTKALSIKQKLVQNSFVRKNGWKFFIPKIKRNDVVTLSKTPVYLNKRYKMLLHSKQRFQLSVFLNNKTLKKIFHSGSNIWKSLNSIWLRLDFLIFRLFPVSSLFFVRQIIKHGFVLLNAANIKGSQQVKTGDIVVITKHLYFPKEIFGKNKFPFISPLFFDVDINFKTQSFVLNSIFINSYVRFSTFSGFSFDYGNIKNFYNR